MTLRATLRTLATVASLGLLAACMPPQGPHVRVATATPAELAAVRDKDNVWYEFEAGDVIPLQLGFVGAIQGGTMERGGVVRAKRKLYFVMKKNAPMQISFDGKSFASPDSSKFVVAVAPREGQPAGELVWIIYIGESGNVQEALEAEIKDSKSATKR